jgi:hypothetical protein
MIGLPRELSLTVAVQGSLELTETERELQTMLVAEALWTTPIEKDPELAPCDESGV